MGDDPLRARQHPADGSPLHDSAGSELVSSRGRGGRGGGASRADDVAGL